MLLDRDLAPTLLPQVAREDDFEVFDQFQKCIESELAVIPEEQEKLTTYLKNMPKGAKHLLRFYEPAEKNVTRKDIATKSLISFSSG